MKQTTITRELRSQAIQQSSPSDIQQTQLILSNPPATNLRDLLHAALSLCNPNNKIKDISRIGSDLKSLNEDTEGVKCLVEGCELGVQLIRDRSKRAYHMLFLVDPLDLANERNGIVQHQSIRLLLLQQSHVLLTSKNTLSSSWCKLEIVQTSGSCWAILCELQTEQAVQRYYELRNNDIFSQRFFIWGTYM